jgi:hypothetical protein
MSKSTWQDIDQATILAHHAAELLSATSDDSPAGKAAHRLAELLMQRATEALTPVTKTDPDSAAPDPRNLAKQVLFAASLLGGTVMFDESVDRDTELKKMAEALRAEARKFSE